VPIRSAKVLVFWRDSENQNGLIRRLAGLARFAAVQEDAMKAGRLLVATHALYPASGILLDGYSRTVGSERPSFARDLAAPLRCLKPGLLGETTTAKEAIAGAGPMLVLPISVTLMPACLSATLRIYH